MAASAALAFAAAVHFAIAEASYRHTGLLGSLSDSHLGRAGAITIAGALALR